jgi:hypothetical protein
MSNTAPDRMTHDPGHEFEDVDWQIYGTPPAATPRPVTLTGFANRGWPQAMQCATPALAQPNYSILSTFRNGDSQHPAGTLSAGERLIGTVAKAVMESPSWGSLRTVTASTVELASRYATA